MQPTSRRRRFRDRILVRFDKKKNKNMYGIENCQNVGEVQQSVERRMVANARWLLLSFSIVRRSFFFLSFHNVRINYFSLE